jgi:3-dehydroquinate dehydratase/shikimate dehydrogenase
VNSADLFELRLDAIVPAVQSSQVPLLVNGWPRAVVATCRSAAEGGAWDGSETARREILRACLASDAAFVDVELESVGIADLIRDHTPRTVVSKHWFTQPTEGELDTTVERILALRPAVAKLVVAISAVDDALPLLRAAERLRAGGVQSCCFPMGPASGAGRLLALGRGDAWTYAAAPVGPVSAAGQWPAHFLRQHLQAGRWRHDDACYAVVGEPIGQSLSPAVFNAAFAAAGIGAHYLPLPAEALAPVLRLAAGTGVTGLSVTMPFKGAALAAAATCTRSARRCGAANTLRAEGGVWRAHNTDGEGLVAALAPVADLAGCSVAVLGAGGAAQAGAAALADAGAGVTMYARDTARADSDAAGRLGVVVRSLAAFPRGEHAVVVNATPVGMGATAETPIPTDRLNGSEVVLDMIYRPCETELLRVAAAAGCRVVSGLEMFLAQARAQYEWWIGEAPPGGIMRRAALEILVAEGETV